MEIISIEKKTFEELVSRLGQFFKRMDSINRQRLDRITKDAATIADENQPLLGGEHYLTDRELSQRLKISRRTLQDYRNNGILPYRQLGGKILYRRSDIEHVL